MYYHGNLELIKLIMDVITVLSSSKHVFLLLWHTPSFSTCTHIENHTYVTQIMQLAKEVLHCRVCQAIYGSQIWIYLVISM